MSDFQGQKYKRNSTWSQEPVHSMHTNVTWNITVIWKFWRITEKKIISWTLFFNMIMLLCINRRLSAIYSNKTSGRYLTGQHTPLKQKRLLIICFFTVFQIFTLRDVGFYWMKIQKKLSLIKIQCTSCIQKLIEKWQFRGPKVERKTPQNCLKKSEKKKE